MCSLLDNIVYFANGFDKYDKPLSKKSLRDIKEVKKLCSNIQNKTKPKLSGMSQYFIVYILLSHT